VDPPLSAAEQEFLKDIREYVHKLFLVLNKIDYVEAADRQEAHHAKHPAGFGPRLDPKADQRPGYRGQDGTT
jgi:hypothetical protein